MTALCTHGVQTGAGYSCSACITTPHIVAALDQELAEINTHLDHMVAAYRRIAPERGELQALADMTATVNATYGGTSPGALLAGAIRRLAASEGATS